MILEMKKNEDKYFINLVGEYAVCSELAKRKIQANLTLGNKKAVDIIVLRDDNKAVTIEVKTTKKNKIVTGFFQKYNSPESPHPQIWVLVSIDEQNKTRFFILTHQELASIQMKVNKMSNWKYVNGVDNIPIQQITDYENKWEKILN